MATATRARGQVRAALFALTVTASASAYSARLSWSAPTECPDAEVLRHSVERLLGEPLTEGAAVDASAEVTAEPDGRFSLTLTLRTDDGEGTRRLRTESCQSALDVAAFAVALALNPELEAEPPSVVTWPSEPEQPEAPPPSSVEPPAPIRLPPPVVDAPPPIVRPPPSSGTTAPNAELWATVSAVGDSSLLPAPALGVTVTVEALLARRLRLGAGPLLFLPQHERLEGGAGGFFSLWTVQGFACGVLGAGLELCPVFQYGTLHGEGRRVAPRLEQLSRVYAPGAAALGSYALARSFLARAGFLAIFPLNRDTFVVRDGVLHRTPRVSFELSLGVATRAF